MKMDFNDYTSFAGMKIFVSRPVSATVKRTWKERLFSMPWKPFKTTKVIMKPALISGNKCYRFGDEIHCGELFYDNLKKSIATM